MFMRWSIFLSILVICACKKSLTNDQQINNSQQRIVGKWKLIQYYRDNTDGTGEWVPTDTGNVQIIQFTSDGKFTHNNNFVIQQGIDRYKFLEPHKILLYSTFTQDSAKYYYQQDQPPELIFNPLCTEFSCMTKFGRLE